MSADSRVSADSPVSTPIADELLAEAARSGVSDDTWLVLSRALGDRPILDGGAA